MIPTLSDVERLIEKLGYKELAKKELLEQIKHFEEEAPMRDDIVRSYLEDKCINIIVEEIVSETEKLGRKKVIFLDVAAGSGFFTEKIMKKLNERDIETFPYALDLTPSMLKRLKKRNIKAVWGIAERIEESIKVSNDYYNTHNSIKFDVIISTLAFHHFLEPEKALKSMKKVLKENGKVIIIDILKHEHVEILENLKDTRPGYSLKEIKNIGNKIFRKVNVEPLEAYCMVNNKKINLYKAIFI
ncbi:class I SAM-dependent methyltransferase [Marinitoga aeolica]|uniref:Class I SAM-dependent methyltransferase n=1 Tax=Marinitoga aeolica TaxID=2809031 RepID=A0ABY8PSJ6_9BACT|nr:class I SAM-dependent methyltransferase [Marinitoga aeolica]WGS65593.1 class I SAM-dependent methyltransferase [Marinitoga aeolica]